MNLNFQSHITPTNYQEALIDLYKFVPYLRYDHLKIQKEVYLLISKVECDIIYMLEQGCSEYYRVIIKKCVELDFLWQYLFKINSEL